MRKSHKILSAVAVAGIVFAGGSAFTGTGLNTTAGGAQFIGGEVSQTVTGAILSGVTYDFGADATKTTAQGVSLGFADNLTGRTVTVTPEGGNAAGTITCAPSETVATACSFGGGVTGLTGLIITVS